MSTMTEDSIRYGLELVEWDWAYNARATRLHHPRLMTEGEVAEWCDNGSLEEKSFRMSCGRLLYWPSIPGLFSRLAMPRCGGCCRALGYPPGTGSPKNDDECRPLVEARMVHLFDRGLDDGGETYGRPTRRHRMNHQTEQRPLCPECGKRITVKKDGTLRHHSNGIPQYVGSPWSRMCSGTGQAPLAHGESVATKDEPQA